MERLGSPVLTSTLNRIKAKQLRERAIQNGTWTAEAHTER